MTMRRQHRAECKAKVALEALHGERTIHELAAEYGVHPVQITQWKKVVLGEGPQLFSRRRGAKATAADALKAALDQQIGPLKVELDWLKKKLAISVETKRPLVEPAHPRISRRRQCALLGLSRAGLYYAPVGESTEDVELRRLLAEPYTATPFDGSRRMTAWLRSRGDAVKHKGVRRLLRTMGLEASSAKPRLSQPAEGQTISPDLLRGVTVSRRNQVWRTALTSVRLQSGVVSLVAVMDWFSRYVLSGAVSITLDVACCLEALAHALSRSPPEICNTDHRAPFTRGELTARLQQGGIRLSRDGRGRALDHVFVERLWHGHR